MAVQCLSYVLFFSFLQRINGHSVLVKMPKINEKDFDTKSHFNYKIVLEVCKNRNICSSNDTNVCATRRIDNDNQYKDFKNICYLFLSNMCDYPGEAPGCIRVLDSNGILLLNHNLLRPPRCLPSLQIMANLSYLRRKLISGGGFPLTDNVDDEVILNLKASDLVDEFSTVQSGSCENYLTARRNEEDKEASDNKSEEDTTIYNSNETDEETLRSKKKQRRNRTRLYEVDTAYDYHPCPLSCPDVYAPVCVNVNRGQGKYFKIMNFVNHCASDVYYCKNWREFAPPPYQGEDVRSSPLSWSFCGSSRYLQFARFSEVTSSLGHYGWLAGNQRYTHIMEPHERKPGYG